VLWIASHTAWSTGTTSRTSPTAGGISEPELKVFMQAKQRKCDEYKKANREKSNKCNHPGGKRKIMDDYGKTVRKA
jgi:hypothetical protein